MTFKIGKLAQIIHVTDDLAGARSLYGDVFGGQCYYEGYSPFEKRDASIYAIGDFTVEPMAPSDEPGADQLPVGRFLGRFGPHLHSLALNVKGITDLADHLADSGIRLVGPGGADLASLPDDAPKAIYSHPKDSHLLIEFVDFGPELMAGSPRLGGDWDPGHWRTSHPLGIDGPSHVTLVVHDIEAPTRYFTDVLGCQVFHESEGSASTVSRFVLLGSETVLEIAQPIGGDTREARDLDKNGEILHSFSMRVVDIDKAVDHLAQRGIGVLERRGARALIDPAASYGALISLTAEALPGDPRSI